ncbi:hypothetical protein N9740_10270, partial [Pseudomonadales bacterium]|nr:hypothetical protein [Pseudomonadales bacterium]
ELQFQGWERIAWPKLVGFLDTHLTFPKTVSLAQCELIGERLQATFHTIETDLLFTLTTTMFGTFFPPWIAMSADSHALVRQSEVFCRDPFDGLSFDQ